MHQHIKNNQHIAEFRDARRLSPVTPMALNFCWKCAAKHTDPVGRKCNVEKLTGIKPANNRIPVLTIVGKKVVRSQHTSKRATRKMPSDDESHTGNEGGAKAANLTTDDIAQAMEEAMKRALDPIKLKLANLEEKSKQQDVRKKARKSSHKTQKADSDGATGAMRNLGLKELLSPDEEWEEEEDSQTPSSDDSRITIKSPSPRRKSTIRRRRPSNRGKKPKKSGRDMTAENCYRATVPWPHFYVFEGEKMRGVHYDDLTLGEWIYGFVQQMQDEKWEDDKEHMFRYFSRFTEDIKDRPGAWETIRSLHGIVLIHIERGSITWKSRNAIARLRTRYLYSSRRSPTKQQSYTVRSDTNMVPCPAYQKGTCDREGSHSGYTHMCGKCWRDKARVYRHPESACYGVVGAPARRKGQF